MVYVIDGFGVKSKVFRTLNEARAYCWSYVPNVRKGFVDIYQEFMNNPILYHHSRIHFYQAFSYEGCVLCNLRLYEDGSEFLNGERAVLKNGRVVCIDDNIEKLKYQQR